MSDRFERSVSLILALLIISVIPELMLADNHAEKIDEFLKICLEREMLNGSVLVAEAGEIILNKGYGYADLEWEIPCGSDTKFRLCSATKQFTAMAVMQLVEKGKIDLDTKITDYLTDYRPDTGDKVTVRHLLTHTSGIPNFTLGPWSELAANMYSLDAMVKDWGSPDLAFEPGEQFEYSNTGFMILSAIIEKVSGQTYEQVLQENIFDPAGMVNTVIDHPNRIVTKRAARYNHGMGGMENERFTVIMDIYGAGALLSTTDDLYRYDQALYSNQLLSKKLKKAMMTPNNYSQKHRTSFGLGWEIQQVPINGEIDSLKMVYHDGGWVGSRARFARFPDERHLIVILNNTDRVDLNAITRGIVDILYDKPYQLPKVSFVKTLLEIYQSNGIEAAITEYQTMKKDQSELYRFNPGELNMMGYILLGQGAGDAAKKIFELNIEEYPNLGNTYDSLAEAYMQTGDDENAIKYYAKSLEIDPLNYNAIRMLSKIIGDEETQVPVSAP